MEQEYIDRVEAYFAGALSSAEKEQYELDMKNDTKLKELHDQYILAIDAVDVQVEQELRSQFGEWEAEQEEQEVKTRKIAFPGIWKYAASLVFMLGIAYIFFINNAEDSRREIALAAYELPDSPSGEMGSSDELWSRGVQSFKEGEFAIAAEHWSKITDPTPEQQYYTAHAYFNTDSLERAAHIFEQVSSTTNNYSPDANWNLLLSYLALEDSLSFRNQYDIVKSEGSEEHRQEAERLAKKSNY